MRSFALTMAGFFTNGGSDVRRKKFRITVPEHYFSTYETSSTGETSGSIGMGVQS
jgi:hypothetical protein